MAAKRGTSRTPSAPQSRTPVAPTANIFASGGEMGELMRAMDWSATKLGPVETWPQSLRTMAGVVLGSRFPMLLWWGPDLVHLYNDGYRPMLTDKHPASLGAPGAQVWSEIWDVVGPMARGVQEGGPATWSDDLQLFITTGAIAEERYFTFSYSPVPGDDGRIGGILGTVQETTAKVQGEREIRMLHALAARAAEVQSEAVARSVCMDVLCSNNADLPFALLYVVNGDGVDGQEGVAALAAASGCGGDPPASKWPLKDVLGAAREIVVGDIASRLGALPCAAGGAQPEHAVVLPLLRAGQSAPFGFLVLGVSPHRVLDDRYRQFFRAAASQVQSVLTAARAYESERRRAESLAEVDRAKTAFFSNVSHEFRTPLTLVLGPIEDALNQRTPTLDGSSLRAMHRNALRLLRLVNSLLDFARIEAGRLQLTFVATDLATLTADLASSFRSLVERAGLRLVIDCPPGLPLIYVDPAQWEKVVLNLLSNAFKFTFHGEITLRLRARADGVELTVTDTGTGIPDHELPHVFERFHRVEGARSRSFEGTGIGLSLVQELVRLHGGTVGVESVAGTGSTFYVSLRTGRAHLPADRIADRAGPLAGAEPYLLEASNWVGADREAQGAPEAPTRALPPPSATDDRTESRRRILVVDDNADMRAYLERLLAPTYDVSLAGDGVDALSAALANPPAMVLSDVMMPRMDGVALVAALRAHPSTRHVPIVLVSARAGEDAMVGGIDTGADDYLVKPFSARDLVARVRTHLSLAEARSQAARIAEELAASRLALLEQVRKKNADLESFSYSVSHDLRAPLRAIDGFSLALQQDYGPSLPAPAMGYLDRVRAATVRMGQLIDDLLALSRLERAVVTPATVDLSAIADEVVADLADREPQRVVDVNIEPGVDATADPHLLRVVMENLLGNAWKYSSGVDVARITFGKDDQGVEPCYFVSDNGAGFNAAYADSLFRPFQRLHTDAEFPGHGIGLATVASIIRKHGGRVWAEGKVGAGATFRWTLPAGA